MPSRRWLPWVLLVVLLAAGGAWFVRKGTAKTTELPVYTLGAERMWAGEEIYRPTDAKPFTYPPFFALPLLPLVPLGHLPVGPPRPWPPVLAWYLINAAVLGWIVVALHRACAVGGGRRALLFWSLTLALAARHVAAALENQSHDLLVFAAVFAGALRWADGCDRRGGVWFGLAAACKATPLLFAVPLVVQRRGLALLALVLAGAAATLLPDLVAPRGDGRWWVMAWADTFLGGLRPGETAAAAGAWTAGSELNQSLSGTLHRLLTPVAPDPSRFVRDVALVEASSGLRSGVILAGRLLVLALVALAALRPRRGGRRQTLAQAGAVVCGMVLLSPMSSKSHFCVLLLPLGVCAAAWLAQPRRDPWLAVLLVAVFVFGTATSKGLLGRELGGEVLAYGAVTWTALLALLAVLRVLWLEPERGVGSAVNASPATLT